MFTNSVCLKRLALCLAAFCISLTPALAQGVEFSFSNELSSDIVNVSSDGAEFAGIEDEVVIEMTSERVDLGVDMIFGFDLSGNAYDGSTGLSSGLARLYFSSEDFDWYAAFRPIKFLEFGLSKDYELAGSYMYVEDDNVAGSKMGSDGLTLAVMPIDGLKIAFTMPFSYMGSTGVEQSDAYLSAIADNIFKYFQFGFGAEYNFRDIFAIGAAARSYHDFDINQYGYGDREWAFSAAAGIFPVEGLSIYAGYSFNDYEGLCDVYGQHLLNASVSYEADRFAVGADFLTNFGSDTDSDYDLYAALYGEFSVTDPLLVYLTVAEQNTLGRDASDWAISFAPGVEFDTGRVGAFSLEVEVGLENGEFDYVCFPLSWTYEF